MSGDEKAAHIGIVACSSEGAALCYRTVSLYGSERLGAYDHPEVSLHTHSLAEYMEPIGRDDWKAVADLMLSSAHKLKAAGADFLICPDNTIHIAFPHVAAKTPLPWLHIAEVVAAEAKGRGYRRIGILGTRFTMEGPVYPEKLGALGLEYRAPRAADIALVDRTIFDELVHGRVTEASLAAFQGVIQRLGDEGCDAVVLGCTEIPLLVPPERSPLPTLDSTRLLARAAVDYAIGQRPGSRKPRAVQ
jgi:aspartate racemase